MPHIAIQMYPGRDQKTKDKIAKRMQAVLAEEMQADKNIFPFPFKTLKQMTGRIVLKTKLPLKTYLFQPNFSNKKYN